MSPAESTLSAFAAANPPPDRLSLVEVRGMRYFVWIARSSGLATLLRGGSGPPCYVFDEGGTLVGWTATTGDRELEDLVAPAWHAPTIDVDAAVRLTRSAMTSGARSAPGR